MALEARPVDEKEKKQSRREFARKAALFSVAVPMAGAGVLAEKDASATARAETAKPAQAKEEPLPKLPADFPKLSEQSRAEVEARYEGIVKTYGGRFSTEQKAELRRLSYVAQPSLDRLRSYSLQNSDGPALYLKPVVEREKKPAPAAAAKSAAKKP